MATPSGYPSSKKLNVGVGFTNVFATLVPTDPYRNSEDNLRFAFRVGSSTVPRTATADTGESALNTIETNNVFWIGDTATPARRGDFVRFENGNAQFIEFPILKVETNRFLISCIPDAQDLPVAGDDFYIMRYSTQRVADDGSQLVTVVPVSYQPVQGGSLNTTTTPILDSAYTELVASTPDAISEIEVFNKTGIPLIIAIGPAASEDPVCFIGSDGLQRQQVPIPAGSRISLKTIEGTANAGWVLLNAFG